MPKKTFRKIEPLTSQMRVVLKDPLGSGIVGIVVQGEAEALAAAVAGAFGMAGERSRGWAAGACGVTLVLVAVRVGQLMPDPVFAG